MKPVQDKSESGKKTETIQIVRGQQSEVIFNAGIVGGGNACLNLLKLLDEDRSSRLKMRIIGVSDINPNAPGFRFAQKLNLFTTTNFKELFTLEGLNLIIELTGSNKVLDQIMNKKPSGLSVIDHVGIRLLWDLIQMEVEKDELEKEWQRYLEALRKQTKVIPDSLPYRIMVINMDKTVETVNQTFLNAFDLTEDMVRGKHCYELKYGIDRPCIRLKKNHCYIDDRLDEIKEKGIFSTYEEYSTESGESRFEVITLAPIFNDQGDVVQILEASRDVTDRIKLEKEANKSNTFLQNVIQSTVDGIVVVDTKGNVLIFNEGMERLTGFSANEIINSIKTPIIIIIFFFIYYPP